MSNDVIEHFTDYAIKAPWKADSSQTLILVVLNYNLPSFTPVLWEQARLRICADGGANRLYDDFPVFFPEENPDIIRSRYVPDVIKGDLDSVRTDVANFYRQKGTLVIDEHEDQDSTDLEKCISFVISTTPQADVTKLKILVVGALGGRLDHELANIHILHKFQAFQIVILSNESLVLLLPSGRQNVIRPDRRWEGPHCGVVPVGFPSKSTTTTGLRWNLDKWPMAFGTLVSTSNEIVDDVITVTSDVPLIWTIEVRVG